MTRLGNDRYEVSITVWPFSTSNGVDKDQEAAGSRYQTHEVWANSIDAALAQARLIQIGIMSNPRVWQATIMAVVRKDAQ